MKKINGEELLARSLAGQGLGHVFTVPAGRVASVVEALEREEVVRVVRANNETAAAAMADGFTRRSRKCSLVITEDRGAALSQVSAVTNAWADKIPMLSVSLCSDDPPDFNKGVERERFDQNGVFQPVTHWRKRIESVEDIPRAVEEAMSRCRGDRMGPVHLDIPTRLLKQTADAARFSFPEPGSVQQKPVEPPRIAGEPEAVRRAAELIQGAKRPLLFFGGGVNASGAHAQALAFMERWRIPAATTMGGIGAVPLEHELCLGGPSYTAGETFHVAIQEADVVVAVGVAFGGLEGFGLPPVWSSEIKYIHVDMSPYQMGLNVPGEVYILGDARTVLAQLDAELSGRGFAKGDGWDRWSKRLAALKRRRARRLRWDAKHEGRAIHQG
jgi:acetolactate synthase-1/2/3 large subunit